MSAHNILRKHKILETNPKCEEIINFYLIFLYIFSTFIAIYFGETVNVYFSWILLPYFGPIRLGIY